MPRPQIVTWLERMRQAEKSNVLLMSQKKCYKPLCWKSRSYLGLLACIILDSPDKKLSTSQILDKMMAFMAADSKRIEKPVKTCLSSHECFVKFSDPQCPSATDLWTLDKGRMTKNVKDHVKATLQLFPGFSSKVSVKCNNRREPGLTNTIKNRCFMPVDKQVSQELQDFKLFLKRCSTTEWRIVALPTRADHYNQTSVAWSNVALKPVVQYSGPFSTESLLKEDEPQPYHNPKTVATV
ncbi:hypothetical protein MHYP_G00078130 [Metynnis hypsauchen]